MIVINNTADLNIANINSTSLVLSYTFLTIHGLPFCSLYAKKLLKLHSNLSIALEVKEEQGTATLAIIENFPNIIVSAALRSELEIIKQNSNSITKLFNNLQEFSNYIEYLLLKNK